MVYSKRLVRTLTANGEKARKKRFSTKLLGKKLRTSVLMHRISVKFYENGVTLKPIATQGTGDPNVIVPEPIFLCNDSANALWRFLDGLKKAQLIVEELKDE